MPIYYYRENKTLIHSSSKVKAKNVNKELITIFAGLNDIDMQAINVKIDISTPTGRRLMREVEKHPKIAKIEYPLPEEIMGKATYTVDEVFEECYSILSDHYKCDVRQL